MLLGITMEWKVFLEKNERGLKINFQASFYKKY